MAAILLRRDPSLTDVNSVASIYPNEKPTDINRDATTYQKRKQHHTKKLTEILPEILTTADDTYAYNQFCNELNDCYDTDMLLQICITFENKIKDGNNKRYAEYLFAKLAAWAAQEARLCNYIVQLQNNQTAEGASTLVHALTTLNRQNFFKTLNSELNPNQTNRPPFTTFHSDQDVLGFLAGIHQPSSRKIIKQQLTENNTFITANKSLLDTNDLIQQAINNIAIFPWDKLTQKQKFIHKVVDALKQPGKTVSINTGVLFSQKPFTFNRKELLVLIRTNPALCAEYQTIANHKSQPNTLFSESNHEMLAAAKVPFPTLSPTPVVHNVVQVIQQIEEEPVIELPLQQQVIQQHPDSINFAASAHAITALLERRQLPPNTPPNNNGRNTPIATPVDLGVLTPNNISLVTTATPLTDQEAFYLLANGVNVVSPLSQPDLDPIRRALTFDDQVDDSDADSTYSDEESELSSVDFEQEDDNSEIDVPQNYTVRTPTRTRQQGIPTTDSSSLSSANGLLNESTLSSADELEAPINNGLALTAENLRAINSPLTKFNVDDIFGAGIRLEEKRKAAPITNKQPSFFTWGKFFGTKQSIQQNPVTATYNYTPGV